MADPLYKRLSGSQFGLVGKSSLWLANDHLINIQREGYTEIYTRFNLRDIQAFYYRENYRRLWISLIFLIPLVVTMAIALSADSIESLVVVLVIIAVPMAWNWMLGPGCTCHIRTAVQVAQVPAINRISEAHKVGDELKERITAIQGELTELQKDSLRAGASLNTVVSEWQNTHHRVTITPAEEPAAEEPAASEPEAAEPEVEIAPAIDDPTDKP